MTKILEKLKLKLKCGEVASNKQPWKMLRTVISSCPMDKSCILNN